MFHHIKKALKSGRGRTGIAIGAAVAVPVAAFSACEIQKHAWLAEADKYAAIEAANQQALPVANQPKQLNA